MRRVLAVAFPWLLLELFVGGRADQEDLTCPAGDQACSSALAGGDGASRPYYWPQQKGDTNRTGLSPYITAFNLAAGPTWSWRPAEPALIRHTPLIDDKRNIFLVTIGGMVYKFSPDGQLLWQYNARAKIPAVPALMDGSLFYNRGDGSVVALDMEKPSVKWEARISENTGTDTACVFALDGLVISATQIGQAEIPGNLGTNNAVVALHSNNGSHAWTFRHRWPSFNFQASSPGDGTMVFQDRAGGVYRVRLSDGSLVWESGVTDRGELDFSTGAAVVGPNSLVYAASNYRGLGIIHAYRLEDGNPVWKINVGMPVNQAVAVGRLAGSERLSVVTGVGENPGLPAIAAMMTVVSLLNVVLSAACCCRCCGRKCRKGNGRFRRGALHLLFIFLLEGPLLLGYHFLSFQAKPGFLFFVKELPAAMVALDAETGETRWSYTPPRFEKPACEGDAELLLPLTYRQMVLGEPGDPVCLPDNWAQTVIDGAGTTYGGHQDGYLYAIRDTDGSRTIDPETEVSRYYVGSAFQASQAMAPNMLAAASCGGALFVWKS